MTLDAAYVEVAERSLAAAYVVLAQSIQEKATFFGYHAFESIGGAYCTNRGATYPKSHRRKINDFTNRARKEKFAIHVAQLAISYQSIRNAVLYPEQNRGRISRPKAVLSEIQARRLIGRTQSLITKVKREL